MNNQPPADDFDDVGIWREFRRPVVVSIVVSAMAELVIFVVWGLILYPEGNWLQKLLWTVVFCGVGMGAATGALICALIVDRLFGWKAIAACSILGVLVLGVGCNLLCYSIDLHIHFFGAHENAVSFVASGIGGAAIGGALIGWLLFSEGGVAILRRVRL
ncbi:hypothetical protein VSU19_22380 [Verrucomicrobiales bacterium BCK34]|nr:hypothetical protein [Verrucomicrobiales bacterium BCK34]